MENDQKQQENAVEEKQKAYIKGTKVICINDTFSFGEELPDQYKDITLPKYNKKYTVRGLHEHPKGCWGIHLKEIVNDEIDHDVGGLKEPIFSIDRFEVDETALIDDLLGDKKNMTKKPQS